VPLRIAAKVATWGARDSVVLMLALVGDYNPAVTAHVAIPRALALAKTELHADLDWKWIGSASIRDAARDLAIFSAVWVVPASPYANMAGVLDAIRFARETHRPFLGTCGGFQHALIEFARNVAGLTSADHAETNPSGENLVVTPLACSLVEKTGRVRFAAGSRLRQIYGSATAEEGYHCSYGVNPAHRIALERGGLQFTAFDDEGDIRAAELPPNVHPFFTGTLFQPERVALRGETPPVVRAFLAATARRQ
jgi:CTP synthase (UTP-ammonia lyase)